MGDHRLAHDCSRAGAAALWEAVAPLLPELPQEVHRACFEQAYRVCFALLQAYDVHAHREEARRKPSRN